MKLFGFEIRRIPPPPPILPPLDRMKLAVDALNTSWQEFMLIGNKDNIRPWIIWEEKRVVLSSFRSKPEIIHE